METITLEFIEEAITLEIEGTASVSVAVPFRAPVFADPLVLDGSLYKDFKCGLITDDTTINLTGVVDGDAGMIEIIMDGVGGYTVVLGTMFTKNVGGGTIDTVASADNFIAWIKIGTDIIYSISQVE
jgi:hypothetical protein